MAAPVSSGAANGLTITDLKKSSILSKELPGIRRVQSVHVYDFDRTLFHTPWPNPQIWTLPTIRRLVSKEGLSNGGWWHNPSILAATGEGPNKEEVKAWAGWWNEEVVELVRLSMHQKGVLTVLLTGRGKKNFADLIKRMVSSKKLEFDMICLKPDDGHANASIMSFKKALLDHVLLIYRNTKEVRVYEEEIKQVKGFRDFFASFNNRLCFQGRWRPPLDVAVVEIADVPTTLDPVTEVAEVQKLVNAHNLAVMSDRSKGYKKGFEQVIAKLVFYTGYLINEEDTKKLVRLVKLPRGIPDTSFKWFGNGVFIAPGVASPHRVESAGGMGKKVTFRVTHIGHLKNKVWSVRVQPTKAEDNICTDTVPLTVVLAHEISSRINLAKAIRNWVPVKEEIIFDGVVGEKSRLKVGRADRHNYITRDTQDYRKQPYEQSYHRAPYNARHHDDYKRNNQSLPPYRGGIRVRGSGSSRYMPYQRDGRNLWYSGRRRRGHGYKSLDDVDDRGGYRSGARRESPNGPSNRSGGVDGSGPTMDY